MFKYVVFLCCIIVFLKTSCQVDNFEYGQFIHNNDTLNYRLYKPKTEKNRLYPLVLFFHGAGERGNDNELQLKNGVLNFAKNEIQEKYPHYILAPQCPKKYRWVEVDWSLPSHKMPEEPSKPMQLTIKLLEKLINELQIDTNRLYVTGLSMGGFATWDIIMRYPNKFAAALPICGGADESKAELITHVPVWAFHGSEDKVVIPERTINIVNELKKKNANVKLTIYEKMGHNVWHITYSNNEVIEWLLKQKK